MKEQDISSEQQAITTIYDNYLYNLSTTQQHALFIEHEGKLYTATQQQQLLKLYGRTDKWLVADVKLNKYNINGEIKTRKNGVYNST